MKHLILSPDSIIDSRTNKAFPGIYDELEKFTDISPEHRLMVISSHKDSLIEIPDAFNPIRVPMNIRGSGEALLNYLGDELGEDITDPIILGSKDKDMTTAAHTGSILLRADYALKNNPEDRIYTKDYGLPLTGVDSISSFFEHFHNIQNAWYFKVKVSPSTTLLALTDAATYTDSGVSKKLKEEFRKYLKNDKREYINPFSAFFIVTAHTLSRELAAFDIWDIYPASTAGQINEDLLYFARKGANSFGKKFQKTERLLVRVKDGPKRSYKKGHERIAAGCSDQFGSMIVNPFYKGKLEGKNVCIIDDFTTYGTSCETARNLLKRAGVNKILFIAMGRFGTGPQYKFNYDISGDVFGSYEYTYKGHEALTGIFNNKANKQFIESLGGLMV